MPVKKPSIDDALAAAEAQQPDAPRLTKPRSAAVKKTANGARIGRPPKTRTMNVQDVKRLLDIMKDLDAVLPEEVQAATFMVVFPPHDGGKETKVALSFDLKKGEHWEADF